MTMRLRTRAFIVCFVPFAILLASSFWMVQRLVQLTVHSSLRVSLRENHIAIDNLQAHNDLQNNRFLKVAGENAALKAGIQLLIARPGNESSRRTVEDQLRELGEHMGFDLLLVSSPDGSPLAGVVRNQSPVTDERGELVPIAPELLTSLRKGVFLLDGRAFQIGSASIDVDDENLASLWLGQKFNLAEFATPVVLLHDGRILQSSLPAAVLPSFEAALRRCKDNSECDVQVDGKDWLTLPLPGLSADSAYTVRSVQNVDIALAPVQSVLDRLFLSVALGSVVVVFLYSVVSSRSMVRPLAALVTHLRNAAHTGELPEFQQDVSPIVEVRELAESYNRAALSVRHARENLQGAYFEFVGSLANALDARDGYTAGHSWRVSQLSCAIAAAMHVNAEVMERVRLGALLHDIGKIGIADKLLQKPSRLTEEEQAIIEQHPVIGRRILEGVQGFARFLPAVEFHHENWDGTGYPSRQRGEETPIEARIIHVADAYDAMTTDRPYRAGMSHDRARRLIAEKAYRQFDPRIVDVFLNLPVEIVRAPALPIIFSQAEAEVEAFGVA